MRNPKRLSAFAIMLLILVLVLSACAQTGASPDAASEPGFFPNEEAGRGGSGAQGTTSGDFGESVVDGDVGAPPFEPMPEQPEASGVDQQGQPIERLIIRTGSINVTVDDTRASLEAIEQQIDSMASEGAFIVSSNVYGSTQEDSPYITISIRVPSERFDETMQFLADLAVEGTTPTMSQSGQDVTEEYVDLASRLESLEAARDRLLEIMENSQTTEELLMAEQQLTQREAEIESIKGRMQYLSQSAALSNITIELQPYILSQPVDTSWRPAETVRRAFESLVASLQELGDFLIYFVVFCGPYLLVIIPLAYIAYRFIRNQLRKRRAGRAAAAAPQNQP